MINASISNNSVAKTVSIRAIEYSLPQKRVTNSELSALHPSWRMAQLELRTGVLERAIAAPGETALDLGYSAAKKLLQEHSIPPDSIDALILCSQSPEYIMPPGSCLLQHKLGLRKDTACFDFNLACSGFVYGLAMSMGFVAAFDWKRILFITADTYSKYISPGDRALVTLFGDGAAATCLDVSEKFSAHAARDVSLYTDGAHGLSFCIPAGGAHLPASDKTKISKTDVVGNIRTDENIHMDGKAIVDFVVREIPPAIEMFLKRNGLSKGDIDLFLFHQASKVSLDRLLELLQIPAAKAFSNLSKIGNTVSSSIPILLRDAQEQNIVKPGMKVLLVGFGVGLSWGCCLVDW
jgi:3-oxoacyl-[acyl-carrier-protein] synthase-3